MSPVTVRPPPPPHTEMPLIIPVDLRSRQPGGLWLRVVFAGLVVFTLALAAVVWSQLLRQVP